jgi:hypothetical protein
MFCITVRDVLIFMHVRVILYHLEPKLNLIDNFRPFDVTEHNVKVRLPRYYSGKLPSKMHLHETQRCINFTTSVTHADSGEEPAPNL